MLAVLGGLADVERDLIRTRTAEGRNRTKARGKHIGRVKNEFPNTGIFWATKRHGDLALEFVRQ
jgi:DNA invertase Pin-like site-specific DNA recombinase